MRTRSFTALVATAVLVFAACGDDDDEEAVATQPAPATEAAAEETEPAADTTEAAADTTEAAGADTTEAAGAETTEAAAAATSEPAAGAATTEAAVGAAEASEAPQGSAAAGALGAADTTEAGAATEATASAAGADTTEAAAAAATTAAAVGGTDAGAGTTEAGVGTTDAGAGTTEAGSAAPGTTETGGVGTGETGEITVGSADFPESQLIAQIYGQALEGAGFDVSYELGIGAREAYYGAVESGEVDLVPEYTGSLLAFLAAPDVPETETVEEQVTAIGEALPDGLEVLTPSTAEDKDTMVCTQETVDEHGLSDLSSLFEVAAEITIGAPPEFEERSPYGLLGFSENYDAEFGEFVPLSFADVEAGLTSGELDCGSMLSTGAWVGTEGLVIIEDDLNIIPHEAVLPLVRSDVVTPELTEALDAVNAALDTETLSELDAQVEVEQLGVDVVAEEWLASLGAGGEPAGTGGDATEAPAGTDAEGTEPEGTEPEGTGAEGTGAEGTGATDGTEAPATTG